MQSTLQNATSAYCLLAAASARRAYLTPHGGGRGRSEACTYAAQAIHGLRNRLHSSYSTKSKEKGWDEVDVTSILFLAAYAVFSEDEEAAERHLNAVRFYDGVIGNIWVSRLQENLEILVAKSLYNTLER